MRPDHPSDELDSGPGARCPAVEAPVLRYCEPDQLTPLLEWLEQLGRGGPTDALVEPRTFTRGTVLPDGRLDLCKQAIGPDGAHAVLSRVAKTTSIHSVLLGTNAIGNDGAEVVADYIARGAGMERTVYLGCNGIDRRGVGALATALAGDRSVSALWLKRNPLGPAGAARLAEMLAANHRLRTLDLFNTGIGDRGTARVTHVLADRNRSVAHVYLGGNGAARDTAVAVAACLARNATLESLYLSVSRIGDDGAVEIARGLTVNRNLETLSLASCDIGAEGARALAEAAASHPSLRVLDLGRAASTEALGERGNRLGDEGAGAIAGLIRTNRTVRSVNIRGNSITSRGAVAIAAALEQNRSLHELGLTRFVARSLRRRMRRYLERNRRHDPDPIAIPAHVAAIRSVYRTLPPELVRMRPAARSSPRPGDP